MRRNKVQLPDSLEMLLDTMCNTFGGIMFIAISLIIMSQIVTKSMKSMTPEEADRRRIEAVSQEIRRLQQQIAELEYNQETAAMVGQMVSPEQKKIIEEILMMRREEKKLSAEIESLENKLAHSSGRLAAAMARAEKLRRDIEAKKSASAEEVARQQKLKQELRDRIAELERKLRYTKSRTVSFAREKETSLNAYWVLLQDNEIFRWGGPGQLVKDEIRMVTISGNLIQMRPVRGTELGAHYEGQLERLFSEVSRSDFFISIVSDENSFDTLYKLRQYLRKRHFKSYWDIDSEFLFSRGGSAGSKNMASE